jgi:NTE family protein
MANYPFKNLIFRGGGIRGIAYLGAIGVLDQNKILGNIKRVAGTSAGCITALVVSFGRNAKQTIAISDSLDFSNIPAKKDNKGPASDEKDMQRHFAHLFDNAFEDFHCIQRLLKEYGWYTSAYFHNWLKKTINDQFAQSHVSQTIKKKNGLQTFSDFREAGFMDLYASVTNVSQNKNEIFSIESYPDMPVADAVRMSMSIPLYFNAVPYNGNLYADGGIVNSYPMEVFDNPKYVESKDNFTDDINWETLGCHLVTSTKDEAAECDKVTPARHKHPENLIQYIEQLFITLLKAQEIHYLNTPNLLARSANISDCGISMVDFNIKPGDCKYKHLFKAGVEGMEGFLKELRDNIG